MSVATIKNDNNQELRLNFKLVRYGGIGTYALIVESKYTINNINFEYYIIYEGRIYNEEIFSIKEKEAKELLLDIGKSIINNIKNLNPIIMQDKIYVDIQYDSIIFKYNIELIFQDSENVFPKLNLEDIFKSYVSVLKNRNTILEEKPLKELMGERKTTISFNDENLKIEINKYTRNSDLYTVFTYNHNISDEFEYEITFYITNNSAEISSFNINSDYYELFNNYNNYLEFIELLINSYNLLDRIINIIAQNESLIKKIISEYNFNETLIHIEGFINGNYNEEIKRSITQKLISEFEFDLAEFIKEYINC